MFLTAVLMLGSSSLAQEANEAASTPDRSVSVLYAPGISGSRGYDRRLNEGIGRGLIEAGYQPHIEVIDWVGQRRGLATVFGFEENLLQARLLARQIIEMRRDAPDRPIILVGHSGGTALIAWALESIPELERGGIGDQEIEPPGGPAMVDAVILIASGLSPRFNLQPAMHQVKGHVYHFASRSDNLILGIGTILFGTLDRERRLGAGMVGFLLPEGLVLPDYAQFAEIPYDPAWQIIGHEGGHLDMMSTDFGETVIAPLIDHALGNPDAPLPTTRPIRMATSQPVTTRPATSRSFTD